MDETNTPDPTPLGTVAEQWTSYLTKVVPNGASPTQIQETRRAFYAGAAGMYLILADPDVSDERIEQHLTDLEAELRAFMEQIGVTT